MAQRIKVVSVTMAREFRQPKKCEDNLNYIVERVKEASCIRPDIIALPEVFPTAGLDEKEQVLELGKELLLDLAKKYKTYLAASVHEVRQGKLYNTGLLVNREGEIVGRYDKIHPTETEIERGITPGKKDQLPIETEFGKVGIQICFDANWPEDWKKQIAHGAKLIIFPSEFPGGKILESLALLNQVYIIPATWSVSGIIDNTGHWLAKTDRFSWWVWEAIDLERTVFHWEYQMGKVKEIYRKYGDKIKTESFEREGLFTIEPNSPEILISEIIKEYGLVTYRDFLERANAAQDKFRVK